MKLIFCDTCKDVFKLTVGRVRSCECGKCRGRYDDNGSTAVTNGKGFALAIGNGSLLRAIAGDPHFRVPEYEDMDVFLAWVREHDGVTNPNSRVSENL